MGNAAAELFFQNIGALIRYGGKRAYDARLTDDVRLPPLETFRDAADIKPSVTR